MSDYHSYVDGAVGMTWHLRLYWYWVASLDVRNPASTPNAVTYWVRALIKAPLAWLFNYRVFGVDVMRPVAVVLAATSWFVAFLFYARYTPEGNYMLGGIATGLWTLAGSWIGLWHFARRAGVDLNVMPVSRIVLLASPFLGVPMQLTVYAIRVAVAYDNCPRINKPINSAIAWMFAPVYKRFNRASVILFVLVGAVGFVSLEVMFYLLAGMAMAIVVALAIALAAWVFNRAFDAWEALPVSWLKLKYRLDHMNFRGQTLGERWRNLLPPENEDVWTVIDDE